MHASSRCKQQRQLMGPPARVQGRTNHGRLEHNTTTADWSPARDSPAPLGGASASTGPPMQMPLRARSAGPPHAALNSCRVDAPGSRCSFTAFCSSLAPRLDRRLYASTCAQAEKPSYGRAVQ